MFSNISRTYHVDFYMCLKYYFCLKMLNVSGFTDEEQMSKGLIRTMKQTENIQGSVQLL